MSAGVWDTICWRCLSQAAFCRDQDEPCETANQLQDSPRLFPHNPVGWKSKWNFWGGTRAAFLAPITGSRQKTIAWGTFLDKWPSIHQSLPLFVRNTLLNMLEIANSYWKHEQSSEFMSICLAHLQNRCHTIPWDWHMCIELKFSINTKTRGQKRGCMVQDILLQRKTTIAAQTFLLWDAVVGIEHQALQSLLLYTINTDILKVLVSSSKPAWVLQYCHHAKFQFRVYLNCVALTYTNNSPQMTKYLNLRHGF